MTWTPERIEMLRSLWESGETAAIIAARMGSDITRNAVIGKARRLNLSSRVEKKWRLVPHLGPSKPRPSRAKPQPSSPKLLQRGTATVQPKSVTLENAVPVSFQMPHRTRGEDSAVMKLTRTSCRFPIGDPRSSNFTFCSATRAPGKVYCGHHYSICYVKPPERDTCGRTTPRSAA